MAARACPSCGQPIVGPDGLFFDQQNGVAGRQGTQTLIRLSKWRMRVLLVLYNANGRPVSRDRMLDAVYGDRPSADAPEAWSAINVIVHAVRKAIRPLGLAIHPIRDSGWQLLDLRSETKPTSR